MAGWLPPEHSGYAAPALPASGPRQPSASQGLADHRARCPQVRSEDTAEPFGPAVSTRVRATARSVAKHVGEVFGDAREPPASPHVGVQRPFELPAAAADVDAHEREI